MRCVINRCKSAVKKGIKTKYSFFRFPNIVKKNEKLSLERRRLWLAAINRKNLNTKYARVCSRHFISGKSAVLEDKNNPDWVPSIRLGYKKYIRKNSSSRMKRYLRIQQRNKRSNEAPNLIAEPKEEVRRSEDVIWLEESFVEEIHVPVEEHTNIEIENETIEDYERAYLYLTKQNELLIEKLRKDIDERDFKIQSLTREIADFRMNIEFFRDDDKKTRYFTGLSHFVALETIYQSIESNLPHYMEKNLNKFQILILTLMKLCLDLPFTYLGYRFGVCALTASNKFYECLLVLSKELKAFVFWPSKHVLEYYTPECFKKTFGNKLAVIIHCFEIFIEKPGNPHVSTFSNNEHNETVKYLIGFAPSGAIIYISKGFAGRASDEYVTENSNFLDFISEGQIVLSDRGFLIQEAINKKVATLQILESRENKLQLHPFAVEETRNLAVVRVHVERVIRTLRQNYLILSTKQPITSVSKKYDDTNLYYDQIVLTCCALINLSPSVIKSDEATTEIEL